MFHSNIHAAATPRQGRGVSIAYVARRLDRSIAWFRANRDDLEKKKGFPAPLDMPGLPRWDSEAIERWFDRQMPAHLQAAAPAQTTGLAAKLKKRAHDIAQGLAGKAAA